MKSIKEKHSSFWEGFQSAFDLYGLGFERNYRISHINDSWYNVGVFFSNSFNDYLSVDQNCSDKEKEIRSKRKSQRKRYAHR